MASTVSRDSRSVFQHSSVTEREYLAVSAFDDVSWADALSLYADLPWVQRWSVFNTSLLIIYADSDDWIHGNFPLEVTEKALCWDHFSYYDESLSVGHRLDVTAAKSEFLRQAYSWYDLLKTFNTIHSDLGFYLFPFCIGGGSYSRGLSDILTDTI